MFPIFIHVDSKGNDPITMESPRPWRFRKLVLARNFKLCFVFDIALSIVIPEGVLFSTYTQGIRICTVWCQEYQNH